MGLEPRRKTGGGGELETGARGFLGGAAAAGSRGCSRAAIRTRLKDSRSASLVRATVLSCSVLGKRVRAAAQLRNSGMNQIRPLPWESAQSHQRDDVIHRGRR